MEHSQGISPLIASYWEKATPIWQIEETPHLSLEFSQKLALEQIQSRSEAAPDLRKWLIDSQDFNFPFSIKLLWKEPEPDQFSDEPSPEEQAVSSHGSRGYTEDELLEKEPALKDFIEKMGGRLLDWKDK